MEKQFSLACVPTAPVRQLPPADVDNAAKSESPD
jgi:hypothetical protein